MDEDLKKEENVFDAKRRPQRFKFREDKVIHNGTTTIVKGWMSVKFSEQFLKHYDLFYGPFADLQYGALENKGVSKLAPEDEYNEAYGNKLASKRCEVKVLKAAHNKLVELRKNLQAMLEEVNQDIDYTIDKMYRLEKK